MAKPKHTILTEDGVITQEALLAYAQGRLSVEETVQMEKLLKDDPFAQDALEGVRSADAPAEIKTVVSSLNVKLREKTGAREKKKKGIEIHWATYAYAAMIVGILIGLGFVMVHFIAEKDQNLAMNKNMPQAEESKPVTEEKPQMIPDTTRIAPTTSTVTLNDTMAFYANATGNATSVSSGAVSQLDAEKMNKDQVSQNITAAPPVAAADKKNAQAPTKTEATKGLTINGGREDEGTQYVVNGHRVVGNAEQKPKLAEEKKKQTDDAATAGYYKVPATATREEATSTEVTSAKKLSKEGKADKFTVTPTDNLKAARVLFDAGDFKEAGKAYNKILNDLPDNSDALYFGGICEYHNGKNRQAEKSFDKLLKANQYVEGSKW
ncbi:MAG: hypothetical protein JWO03_3393, partial [Bacteroidetes bacterium]|nr:hypothetical protein [Bacteroidota bacterium]